MTKTLELCNEGLHYTGAEIINDENHPLNGGIEFVQSFPHPMLCHTTEKVVVRKEDIDKLIDWLNSIR